MDLNLTVALEEVAKLCNELKRERDEAIRYIAALEERMDSAGLKAAQEAAK